MVLLTLGMMLLVFVVGATLLSWGLRGRRAGDHPHCRGCGFDLTGLPASSGRCPECGADLAGPGAVARGERRHEPVSVACGALLAATGAAGILISGENAASRIEWVRMEPTRWLLSSAASSASVRDRDRASAELTRRLSAESLSGDQIAEAVGLALAAQGDRGRPWRWPSRNLLDGLLAGGHLTADQIEIYLRQSSAPRLRFKPAMRRGRPHHPIALDGRWDRLTSSTVLAGSQRATAPAIGGAEIDGRWLDAGPVDELTGAWPAGRFGGTSYFHAALGEDRLAGVPNGVHPLATTLVERVEVIAPVTAGPFELRTPLSAPVALAGRDATVDAFVVDPALRAEVRASVAARLGAGERFGAGHSLVAVQVRVDRPPVALAMAVWVRRGDHESRAGLLRVEAGGRPEWHTVYSSNGSSDDAPEHHFDPTIVLGGGTVDVVLRPSQDAADRAAALGTYWGEEVVVEKVAPEGIKPPRFGGDESLRWTFEASLAISDVRRDGAAPDAPLLMDVKVLRPLPLDLIHVPHLRHHGGDESAPPSRTRLYIPAINGEGGYRLNAGVPPAGAERVDVILRPDPLWSDGAAPNVDPPWGGTIVFRDVPVPAPGSPPIPGPFRPGLAGAPADPAPSSPVGE